MNAIRTTGHRVAERMGADPLVIIAAIEALVAIATICIADDEPIEPAVALEAMRNPTRRQRRQIENAVWRALRKHGKESQYVQTIRELREEANLLTPETIEAMYRDKQDGTGDYGP